MHMYIKNKQLYTPIHICTYFHPHAHSQSFSHFPVPTNPHTSNSALNGHTAVVDYLARQDLDKKGLGLEGLGFAPSNWYVYVYVFSV